MKKETLCVQAGYVPENGESRLPPIVQSTTFKYDTSEDMGELFDLKASGSATMLRPRSRHWKAALPAC